MTYMRLQAVTEFYNTTREEPEGRGEGREPVLPLAPQAVSPLLNISKFISKQ